MFRFRLALVIAISFCFVLLLDGIMYWGSNQVAGHFQRSQTAFEAFDRYENLSQEAYRYFKQQMDRLVTSGGKAEADLASSKQGLLEAMRALREHAVKEPAPIADKQAMDQDKAAELERVANLTAFLDASEYRFNEVGHLSEQGKRNEALQALSKFSDEEIDSKFQPLIDAAIHVERTKAAQAKQELENLIVQSRWVTALAAAVAAIFSLTGGIFLLRRVKNPMEALMQGTNEIASGNLSYRIILNSRDEFAYLASHFNKMAIELGVQQEKLRQGRAELENRVAERTHELQQLNQALKRMDAERREFLADISHELRTPITVIRGEAEVTLRGSQRDPDEYKDTLQRILDLSMQLGKYVNDLLFLARSETANLQFDWHELDLSELLASSLEDFRVMAEESAISLSFTPLDQSVWLFGDKLRLRQVLFILGDNACRYSKPGGRIIINTWLDETDVYISISDQGIGIPSQDLERIFERNFRSENARRLHDDGSGLGLPLAKSILKAHGGQISVDSGENAGTTFTIKLPLISTDENQDSNE
ncbi:HAMP domain-containing histidine kinase [Methylomonas sp. SURF-2]|uniref:histidine kinase n=1 Tax=Methylomonas subterranea TaxID=2952225 RepID=A0ABT1TGZ2_9GAMM|nr:HAMP domain-containing sensor histidine kinase [Methylomonas sp. SURF-2]MCQ8104723.1 HAMP domain-containing histidine kinase [Methylomonas sp. SURF-2]